MTGNELPLALRPENQVRLVVNGVAYGGWKSVRISAGIERQARDYDLEVTDRWPGQTDIPRRIRPGDFCQVFIGDDLVMTGYVDATPVKYSGRSVGVSVRGRSKTADLVDCCPPNPGEDLGTGVSKWSIIKDKNGKTGAIVAPPSKSANHFRNQKMEVIAAALAAPYNVQVISEVDTGKPIAEHQVQIGETVFESIDRMMRIRHVLSTDNEYGDLVFIDVGTGGRAATAIELGQNVLSGDSPLDYKGVFSEYIVKGQRSGNDSQSGRAVAEEEGYSADSDDQGQPSGDSASAEIARASDGRATRRRVLVIKQSGQADEGTVQDRADYERAHRAAKALQTTYRVVGWRQADGRLWKPNMMVRVRDALIGFNEEMVIAEVSWSMSQDGLITDIRVGPPDGYRSRAGVLKSNNRLKGGGHDWSIVKDKSGAS